MSAAIRNGAISTAAMSVCPAATASIGPVLPGALQWSLTGGSPRASASFSISFSCSMTSSGRLARSIARHTRISVDSAAAAPIAVETSSSPAAMALQQPRIGICLAAPAGWAKPAVAAGRRSRSPSPARVRAGRVDRESVALGAGMAGIVEGKVALVTGGGGGIGRAAALALAREGARVAVADFAAAAARDTVALINADGGQAITLTGDVTRARDVRAMIADTLTAYGRLDCAFNNAGIAPYQVDASGKKTAEWSEESFDRMIAVNLKGVWLCMKEEIPHMQSQGGGAIVNTASIAGLIGLVTSSAYVAAKHGVIGLTKTAALEYADAKIRVNAVCPGFIKTQMTEKTMRRRGEAIMAQIPLRRMGEPGEIAEMVVWLCSDRASYVTGAAYNVDGGWMAV